MNFPRRKQRYPKWMRLIVVFSIRWFLHAIIFFGLCNIIYLQLLINKSSVIEDGAIAVAEMESLLKTHLDSFAEMGAEMGKDVGQLTGIGIETGTGIETIGESLDVAPRERSERKYAYAFVLGGIHEDRPGYKGFLYDILIAVNVLREKGSTADFVLWAQTSPDSTLPEGSLPAEDERLLRLAGVQVRFLEHENTESFAQIVYEKFRILTMTEYNRVLFLDGDIMPRVNMDYLFRLSDSDDPDPLLRKNLILASKAEPCNTAMFMATPSDEYWQTFKDTIVRQHDEGLKLPYPHFNATRGWGWSFMDDGHPWESIWKKGWRWAFHAAHSDQGLWLYLAKFAFQDVTIVIGHKIQNWVKGPNGKPQKSFEDEFVPELKRRGLDLFLPPAPTRTNYGCQEQRNNFKCENVPYKDFMHFSGNDKPWQHGMNQRTKTQAWYPAAKKWFLELKKINTKYEMGLDVDNWTEKHSEMVVASPFGYLAQHKDHEILMRDRVRKNKGEAADGSKNVGNEQDVESINMDDTDGAVESEPVTVAYAVSFIQCENFQSHSAGLIDASLVLRHSIHQISVRNPKSGSKYDYKMYAIVHRQAEKCSQVLQTTGFEVLVVDNPVETHEIRGDYLRKTIHRELCCGIDEFIKLYAYNMIPEEIFVHVDIDFAFYKPMDNLFDAMLYDKDSEKGIRARSLIERERAADAWPDRIDAFFTRDWPQVAPNKFPPGYQAGFMVARRNPQVFDEIIEVIKEGNYTEGWGFKYGWGEKGYGGYVGAMAMQGLIAYYYDHIQPNASVELNQCRYNHMGMDVRYKNPPNFRQKYGKYNQCRNANPDDICEDCMNTDPERIYSVHYTMCRKPWQCLSNGYPGGRIPGGPRASAINTDTVHTEHCLLLIEKWHALRLDLEQQLLKLTGDQKIQVGINGTYKEKTFLGHCTEEGNDGYLMISASEETLRRSSELYALKRPGNSLGS